MEFILAGGLGFVIGHWLTKRAYVRHLGGPVFQAEVRKQLQASFQAGMHIAADITTMSGHESLAGLIRMSATEIANDNRTEVEL